MEQELKQIIINKMAEGIYAADPYFGVTFEQLSESDKNALILCAKATLAAIQEDYVLVRKEAVQENEQLKAQLARLDDVEGLAELLYNKIGEDIDHCEKVSSDFSLVIFDGHVDLKEVAKTVINYIKSIS